MTVSIPTTRLSSVMTGWGGKETTCSRRSISGFMRSTNGTISASPGSSVRWKRPRRSTTPARACGTIRTPAAATKNTKKNSTIRAMMPALTGTSSFSDERGGALDLDDVHAAAGLEDLAVAERAGAPVLALELDDPAVLRRRLEHEGLPADQRGGAGAQARRLAQVPARER